MNPKADALLAPSVLHEIPEDMADTLLAQGELVTQWNSLTPIARNEWICWVTYVKTEQTRKEHLKRLSEDLLAGKKRPCCWPGCPHRRPEAAKWFR